MKFKNRNLSLAAAVVGLLLASCAKMESISSEQFETQALEAWITQHRPELLENYQPEGGYYVEVLDAGETDAEPVRDTVCWVRYDFSGRDLSGNIILTRNEREAIQAGTYTKYTHYVPLYNICGLTNTSLLEGTYLAMRNTLTLGENYAQQHGLDPEFELRKGSRVTLYMPSRIVGSGGVSGEGGYEGQYSLDAGRPYVVTLTVVDRVKNPLEAEGETVDAFCEANGGLTIFSRGSEEEGGSSAPVEGTETTMPTDPEDPRHPYVRAERWVSACDTVAQVYVNYRFDPKTDRLQFTNPYESKLPPYDDGNLENRIADALIKRFHPDEESTYEGVAALDADSVKLDGTAKIWYIGRLSDGFIFDTNIDEVKKLIYGKVDSEGEALSYTPESGGQIQAFYYTVPNLKFGQWAALMTISTYAYGSTGQSGGTNTITGYSSSYYDYLNYLYYMQAYYGNGGYYGGYYNNYYGSYLGGLYNGYYGGYYGNNWGDSSTTTTTTTINTEIPPFAPLIFEFYIEPSDSN